MKKRQHLNLKRELSHYEDRLGRADGVIERQYLKIAVRHIRNQMKYMLDNYYIQV